MKKELKNLLHQDSLGIGVTDAFNSPDMQISIQVLQTEIKIKELEFGIKYLILLQKTRAVF